MRVYAVLLTVPAGRHTTNKDMLIPNNRFEASASLENCSPRVELSWNLTSYPATCRSWRNEWNDSIKYKIKPSGVCRWQPYSVQGWSWYLALPFLQSHGLQCLTTFSSWTCCPLSQGTQTPPFEARRHPASSGSNSSPSCTTMSSTAVWNFSNNHSLCLVFRFVPCPTLTTSCACILARKMIRISSRTVSNFKNNR